MPDFDVTVDDVRAALHELTPTLDAGRQVAYGQQIVTDNGNGIWAQQSATSDYFNCGINDNPGVAPPPGSFGRVSADEKATLEDWFMRQYGDTYRAAVLNSNTRNGWNFTLVRPGTSFALNFHLNRR
jgi:hypothetical protein